MPSLAFNPDGTPHLHEYVRALTREGKPDMKRYRCNHPDCSHSEFKHNLRGKRSLCSVCRTHDLILNAEQLKLAAPRCVNCSNSKKSQRLRDKISVLENLFPAGGEEEEAR